MRGCIQYLKAPLTGLLIHLLFVTLTHLIPTCQSARKHLRLQAKWANFSDSLHVLWGIEGGRLVFPMGILHSCPDTVTVLLRSQTSYLKQPRYSCWCCQHGLWLGRQGWWSYRDSSRHQWRDIHWKYYHWSENTEEFRSALQETLVGGSMRAHVLELSTLGTTFHAGVVWLLPFYLLFVVSSGREVLLVFTVEARIH